MPQGHICSVPGQDDLQHTRLKLPTARARGEDARLSLRRTAREAADAVSDRPASAAAASRGEHRGKHRGKHGKGLAVAAPPCRGAAEGELRACGWLLSWPFCREPGRKAKQADPLQRSCAALQITY